MKASSTTAGDLLSMFGYSVALNDDGSTLAVGAVNEAGKATGVLGADQDNNDAPGAGAVYVF